MRKVALIMAVALGLSACGSHSITPTEKKHETAAVAAFDAAAKRCLPTKNGVPDPLVLRSHTARVKFEDCAVPPAKRVQVSRCATRVLLGGIPTRGRLVAGIGGCLTKAGL